MLLTLQGFDGRPSAIAHGGWCMIMVAPVPGDNPKDPALQRASTGCSTFGGTVELVTRSIQLNSQPKPKLHPQTQSPRPFHSNSLKTTRQALLRCNSYTPDSYCLFIHLY